MTGHLAAVGLEAAIEVVGFDPDPNTWRARPELRRTFLGGSDAAAVIGVDPYRSPVEVWLEKTGRADGFAGNNATEWGRRLEPIVAQWYADHRPDLTLVDPGERTWRHPDRPWQACTPDRLAIDPDRPGFGVVQVKTAGHYLRDVWVDGDAPTAYRVQVAHEAEVVGATWAVLVCLVAGRDPYVVDVDIDPDLAADLTAAEARFWSTVEADTDPPLVGHANEAADLAAVWAVDGRTELALDGTPGGAALAELRDLAADIDRLETHRQRLRALVELELGDATDGYLDGELAVTWRARTEVDVDALTAEHPDAVEAATVPGPVRFSVAELRATRPDLAKSYRRTAGRTFKLADPTPKD